MNSRPHHASQSARQVVELCTQHFRSYCPAVLRCAHGPAGSPTTSGSVGVNACPQWQSLASAQNWLAGGNASFLLFSALPGVFSSPLVPFHEAARKNGTSVPGASKPLGGLDAKPSTFSGYGHSCGC